MFRAFQAQLSYDGASFVEDQAVDVAGQIGQCDPGVGAPAADGADEQPHLVLLMGEDVLDAGAHLMTWPHCPDGCVPALVCPAACGDEGGSPGPLNTEISLSTVSDTPYPPRHRRRYCRA